MKTGIIFTFLLFTSFFSYSQIADGLYSVRHLGHSQDKMSNTEYNADAPEGSSVIFYKNDIFLTIGNYRVDIIKYDDKETDYSNDMAKIKAFSYFDNKEKIVFIQTLEKKGMYMLWIERGNGSADTFLFTTAEYKE